jgi:HK97 family phage prohead protease
MARWETFSAPLEINAVNEDEGTFSGWASVFGSKVESWIPSQIHRGSFKKTIKERSRQIKVLWQHDMYDAIGLPTLLEERDKGLYIEAKLTLTSKVRDYLMLMKDGVVDALSIGFDAIKFSFQEDEDSKVLIRHIQEIRLYEVSAVTLGADSKALITEVHSLADPDWSQADQNLIRWLDYRIQQDAELLPAERQRVLVAQALLQRVQGDVQETLTRIAHRLEPMAVEEQVPEAPAMPPEELEFKAQALSRIAEMEALTAAYAGRR